MSYVNNDNVWGYSIVAIMINIRCGMMTSFHSVSFSGTNFYPNANSRLGGEALPKFSRNATFGLLIQWRWSRALEMASWAKKRILNFWVYPKKDLENLFTLVVTPRD